MGGTAWRTISAADNPVERGRLLPGLRQMLELADAAGATPVEQQSPTEARASSEIRLAGQWGDKDAVAAIEAFDIASGAAMLPARLYRTPGSPRTILYLHGGGWVVGSLDTHDGMLRAMTLATGANILSVEYRKAPEAPFPAALDDAEAALAWLDARGESLGLDARSAIAMGDSAGATLCASLALRARDRGRPLFGQVLIYPATDLAHVSASRRHFAEGFTLPKTALDWFIAAYLSGGADAADPEVSPLLAPSLAGLPPTLLLTADHDPLRDEGRAYAQRLIEAGNDVAYIEWRGTVHGFVLMDRFTPAARQAIGRIAGWCTDFWSR